MNANPRYFALGLIAVLFAAGGRVSGASGSRPVRNLAIARAARWPSATAVMMMRGRRRRRRRRKRPGATWPSFRGPSTGAARRQFQVVLGPQPGKVRRLADGQHDTVARHRFLAAGDELQIEPAVLVEYAAGADRLDAGDFAAGAEDLLGPHRVWSRMPSRSASSISSRAAGISSRFSKAVHVHLGNALADRLACHVEGQPHLIGRLVLARGQFAPATPPRSGAPRAVRLRSCRRSVRPGGSRSGPRRTPRSRRR